MTSDGAPEIGDSVEAFYEAGPMVLRALLASVFVAVGWWMIASGESPGIGWLSLSFFGVVLIAIIVALMRKTPLLVADAQGVALPRKGIRFPWTDVASIRVWRFRFWTGRARFLSVVPRPGAAMQFRSRVTPARVLLFIDRILGYPPFGLDASVLRPRWEHIVDRLRAIAPVPIDVEE